MHREAFGRLNEDGGTVVLARFDLTQRRSRAIAREESIEIESMNSSACFA